MPQWKEFIIKNNPTVINNIVQWLNENGFEAKLTYYKNGLVKFEFEYDPNIFAGNSPMDVIVYETFRNFGMIAEPHGISPNISDVKEKAEQIKDQIANILRSTGENAEELAIKLKPYVEKYGPTVVKASLTLVAIAFPELAPIVAIAKQVI